MTLQEVTRKINKLVYPERKLDSELIWNNEDPTLEDVLVAFMQLDNEYDFYQCDNIFSIEMFGFDSFIWQLTKPLSQQSQPTIETITKILNT